MKRGNNFIVPVTFDGLDMSTVQSIKFKFYQGSVSKLFEFPGDNAIARENTIDIVWDQEDTWEFKSDRPVKLDTLITLNDSDQNPRTNIINLTMHETGFTQQEVQ